MCDIFDCATVVKHPHQATQDIKLGMILPHEAAHGLYMHSPETFHKLFSTDRLERFWQKTIERSEPWFLKHPLFRGCVAGSNSVRLSPTPQSRHRFEQPSSAWLAPTRRSCFRSGAALARCLWLHRGGMWGCILILYCRTLACSIVEL